MITSISPAFHDPLSFVSLIIIAIVSAAPQLSMAQHNDIEFSYEGETIAIETVTGVGVATGQFPTSGIFQQTTTSPGIASELDEGLGIGPNDTIVYNVLDSLLYWDGSEFAEPAAGVQVRIQNNQPGEADTVVDGASGPQPGSFDPTANTVGAADQMGDFHGHLSFTLEPLTASPPAFGAYGLKLSLASNAGDIADSDPFLLVFNFGLEAGVFNDAIDAFAGLLEPGVDGDFTVDGMVDGADFLHWQRELRDGDALLVWAGNFGAGTSTLTAAATSVPEPSSAILCSALLSLVLGSKTRRRDAGKCDSRGTAKHP